MDQLRMGELLSRIIPLSEHDVEEILHEQSASQRKFGDIALAMGLCKPEHVWQAWLRQLETQTQRICIDQVRVDTQALTLLSADVVREFKVLPLRCLDNELLLAVGKIPCESAVVQLEKLSGKRVRLVLAEEQQLHHAVEKFYPLLKIA